MPGRQNPAMQVLSGGLPVAKMDALRELRNLIDAAAGLLSHTEFSFAQGRFHVFGSLPSQRYLKIMNERRAIHGDAADKSAAHQFNEQRPQPDLDDVPADSPKYRALPRLCPVNCAQDFAQVLRRQN